MDADLVVRTVTTVTVAVDVPLGVRLTHAGHDLVDGLRRHDGHATERLHSVVGQPVVGQDAVPEIPGLVALTSVVLRHRVFDQARDGLVDLGDPTCDAPVRPFREPPAECGLEQTTLGRCLLLGRLCDHSLTSFRVKDRYGAFPDLSTLKHDTVPSSILRRFRYWMSLVTL